MKLDPTRYTELTGPWAGFAFNAGKLWTPEGFHFEPSDMAWWSLTCNMAREWRLMMEQERLSRSGQLGTPEESSVVLLSQALRHRARG